MSGHEPSSATSESGDRSGRQWLEIAGDMDRKTAEAIQLEIRQLARLHGIGISDVRIERAPAAEADSSP